MPSPNTATTRVISVANPNSYGQATVSLISIPGSGGANENYPRELLQLFTIGLWELNQDGSTLASWFDVPANQLTSVFPNIGNFATANLGFLG